MTITTAVSQQLLNAACRLRYDVFVSEEGDRRYADDQLHLHLDSFDVPGDHIFVALDNDVVVGTLRLIDRRLGPYIQDDRCGYAVLANRLGISEPDLIQRIGFTTRGAIARTHRGQGLFSHLQEHLETDARRRGLDFIIGVVARHNDPSFGLLTRRGFLPYFESTFAHDWAGTCIYKAL